MRVSNGVKAGRVRDLLIRFLAAIGLVISYPLVYVSLFVHSPVDRSQVRYVAANIRAKHLDEALERFSADCGRYPTSTEGLAALVVNLGVSGWKGPYLRTDTVPLDTWGRAYLYSDSDPHVRSLGADGKPGGQGIDADLPNNLAMADIPENPEVTSARAGLFAITIACWLLLGTCIYLLSRKGNPTASKCV